MSKTEQCFSEETHDSNEKPNMQNPFQISEKLEPFLGTLLHQQIMTFYKCLDSCTSRLFSIDFGGGTFGV